MPGRRLTPEQVQTILDMRADGHSATHVAAVVGCSNYTVRSYAPGWIGKVPVAPLRQAFLDSGLTASEVARRLGWMYSRLNPGSGRGSHGRIEPNAVRVKRTLGILPTLSGTNGHVSYRRLVDAETVQLIAEAIGISPWSVLPEDEDEETAA